MNVGSLGGPEVRKQSQVLTHCVARAYRIRMLFRIAEMRFLLEISVQQGAIDEHFSDRETVQCSATDAQGSFPLYSPAGGLAVAHVLDGHIINCTAVSAAPEEVRAFCASIQAQPTRGMIQAFGLRYRSSAGEVSSNTLFFEGCYLRLAGQVAFDDSDKSIQESHWLQWFPQGTVTFCPHKNPDITLVQVVAFGTAGTDMLVEESQFCRFT